MVRFVTRTPEGEGKVRFVVSTAGGGSKTGIIISSPRQWGRRG